MTGFFTALSTDCQMPSPADFAFPFAESSADRSGAATLTGLLIACARVFVKAWEGAACAGWSYCFHAVLALAGCGACGPSCAAGAGWSYFLYWLR